MVERPPVNEKNRFAIRTRIEVFNENCDTLFDFNVHTLPPVSHHAPLYTQGMSPVVGLCYYSPKP